MDYPVVRQSRSLVLVVCNTGTLVTRLVLASFTSLGHKLPHAHPILIIHHGPNYWSGCCPDKRKGVGGFASNTWRSTSPIHTHQSTRVELGAKQLILIYIQVRGKKTLVLDQSLSGPIGFFAKFPVLQVQILKSYILGSLKKLRSLRTMVSTKYTGFTMLLVMLSKRIYCI